MIYCQNSPPLWPAKFCDRIGERVCSVSWFSIWDDDYDLWHQFFRIRKWNFGGFLGLMENNISITKLLINLVRIWLRKSYTSANCKCLKNLKILKKISEIFKALNVCFFIDFLRNRILKKYRTISKGHKTWFLKAFWKPFWDP